LSEILAKLARGWPRKLLERPVEEVFASAFRAKGIRKIAEIGPGNHNMLAIIRHAMKNNKYSYSQTSTGKPKRIIWKRELHL